MSCNLISVILFKPIMIPIPFLDMTCYYLANTEQVVGILHKAVLNKRLIQCIID